jgi:hypothetical protein
VTSAAERSELTLSAMTQFLSFMVVFTGYLSLSEYSASAAQLPSQQEGDWMES